MSACGRPHFALAIVAATLIAAGGASTALAQPWVVFPRNPTTEGGVVAASNDLQGAAIVRSLPETDDDLSQYDIGAWQRRGNRFFYLNGGIDMPAGAATDISSADGRTVVGYFFLPDGTPHSFYWNRDEGFSELTSPGAGGHNRTYAVSANGKVLVGEGAVNGDTDRPFRYEIGKGWLELPTFGGDSLGAARDVSDNGAVICGYNQTSPGQRTAFVWTQKTGSIPISLGGAQSFGDRISGDGKFVIGEGELPSGVRVAFRYDVARRRVERLGNLSAFGQTDATLITRDGRVVVGTSLDQFGNRRAFRWTERNGMRNLGAFGVGATPSGDSFPACISGKGDVVGGWSEGLGAGGREAFIWSVKHPMMYLHTALESAFQRKFPTWRFFELQALSRDGRSMLVDARDPLDRDVLIYVKLPRPQQFVKGRGYAYYANLATYGASVYGYYSYIYEQSNEAYYAFLYAYYAYLYDQAARSHVVDYYNRDEAREAYISDRSTAYRLAYASYLYGSTRVAGGQPFAYETAYYANLAYAYMFADLEALY